MNTEEKCRLDYEFGHVYASKWFSDEDEAVRIADLIYHFGGWACVLSGIYEYYPQSGWENMVY